MSIILALFGWWLSCGVVVLLLAMPSRGKPDFIVVCTILLIWPLAIWWEWQDNR